MLSHNIKNAMEGTRRAVSNLVDCALAADNVVGLLLEVTCEECGRRCGLPLEDPLSENICTGDLHTAVQARLALGSPVKEV